MSAIEAAFLSHPTEAEKVNLSDFSKLVKGDTITVFLDNEQHAQIEWLHDRVERDLVYGAVRLKDGRTLPVDCYLENIGCGLLFDTFNSKALRDGCSEHMQGTVFLSMPLPSQLPKRWQRSGTGPKYASFSGREKTTIEEFVEDIKNKGFSEGPSWRGSGFDIRLPIWQTSWQKQDCDVNVRVTRKRQGFLRSAKFLVSVSDHSHRPIWKHGTPVISEDGLLLDEAIDAMLLGLDIVWSKSQEVPIIQAAD